MQSFAAPESQVAVVCSVCGSALHGNAVCVTCLLRAGFDEQNSGRFGDFEIAREEDGLLVELGRGAMGVTYRARDTVLHRTVALKVINTPADADEAEMMRERFLREARAAATLRQPNVAGVFQFGTTADQEHCYCAMELVEGETLEARVRREGPLTTADAVEVAVQVTRALGAAAEQGLVHRDLKPGNIMLARAAEGAPLEVKVIDFGLAKATTGPGNAMELTHGGFVGTPAFASPEQFSGGRVDARSDIYALGVTLWFTLTGRLPFGGTTIEQIRERQQHDPLPLEQLRTRGVPQRLIDLLRACVALDAAERPAPRELLRELEAIRARPAVRRRRRLTLAAGAVCLLAGAALFFGRGEKTPPAAPAAGAAEQGLAVLPFENLSSEQEDAFLVAGLHEDVLESVGKIQNLRVVGRTSVASADRAAADGELVQLGALLRVSHVLQGSVRRAGEQVVVNVALTRIADGQQMWSQRYERTLTDALSLQGEIALEIARELQARLTPTEQSVVALRATDNPEAYLRYLRAREIDRASGDLAAALKLYEEAVALDPSFALARARLSSLISRNDQHFTPERSAQAWREAEAALRLQPTLGEARLAIAYCHGYGTRDYRRALEEIGRASELLPNSAEVPLAEALIYKRENRLRERIAALQRAAALDPGDLSVLHLLRYTQLWVRDWQGALHTVDRLRVIAPHNPALQAASARASIEFRRTGDIGLWREALAADEKNGVPAKPGEWARARHLLAMYERDYAAAERAIEGTSFNLPYAPAQVERALLAVARDPQRPETREALKVAGRELAKSLAAEPGRGNGVTSILVSHLALVDTFLGRKEEAVAAVEAEMAAQTSVVEQNDARATLAVIYAQTGEIEKAITLIEELLTKPTSHWFAIYQITLTDLKHRWVWDPLREHPRFQQILANPEPPTVY